MKVSRSALLPYSARQMFNVITDVPAYPSFLGGCVASEVLREAENEVVARLQIEYGKLKFSFTTRNSMSANESVKMQLVEGPFSHLQGEWRLQELEQNACKVSLDMDFMFANKITQKLFGRVFQSVVSAQLDAFQKRANQLYGHSHA